MWYDDRRRVMIGTVMIDEEMTTTGIVMIETTPRITTSEETTKGIQNDECTKIRIDSTQNGKGTATIDTIIITEGEVFAEMSVVNKLGNTAKRQIQIRPCTTKATEDRRKQLDDFRYAAGKYK